MATLLGNKQTNQLKIINESKAVFNRAYLYGSWLKLCCTKVDDFIM